MKVSKSEKVFSVVNYLFMILLCMTMLFPFINSLAKSFSSNIMVMTGEVHLIPKEFNIFAYQEVFNNPLFVSSITNTVFITIIGTVLTLFLVVTAAYPFSRKNLYGKKVLFFIFLFTMFFNGGMIPTFLQVKRLGLYDSLWSLILVGAVNVYFIILAKSFFEQLPESIQESALIDGCNDIQILFKIILPISKPILATLALFSAVNYWNTFMAGVIYIQSTKKYTVQLFVRLMVFVDQFINSSDMSQKLADLDREKFGTETLKMAILMITSIPIICVYPFLQKYFIKGITLGAVKE